MEILPIKKRRLQSHYPNPLFVTRNSAETLTLKLDSNIPNSRPAKRLRTGNPNLGSATRHSIPDYRWGLGTENLKVDSILGSGTGDSIPEYLWDLGTENLKVESNSRKEFVEYLRGLFDYITEDISDESESIRVFGTFAPGKNDGKAEKNRTRKPWWKSVISRGCDKLRREKLKLRKPLKDLFGPFRKQEEEEEEFEWKIEHKQDPFASLLLPNSLSSSLPNSQQRNLYNL